MILNKKTENITVYHFTFEKFEILVAATGANATQSLAN